MSFSNLKEGDEIFGLVYGLGKVSHIHEDGFYAFEVEYYNDMRVPYTIDGIPGWSNGLGTQTVFLKSDIDLMDYDFAPSEKQLSIKKIIKLRDKKKLEVRCPSGLWQDVFECPLSVSEGYLENGKLHLFRKKK